MPPRQKDTTTNLPPWTGLSQDVALDLELHLCRCRCRTTLFGGNSEETVSIGAPSASGLLIKAVLDFLKETDITNVPSQKELCELIDLTQSVFSANFLKGRPGKTSPQLWTRKARKLLRHLLIARDETPKNDDKERIARRIHEYFFRKLDDQPVPSFFEKERLRLSEPCSPTELADEISWLIRKFERTGKAAGLVWVSGGIPFFTDELMAPVGAITAEAIAAGVDVSFVYASDATVKEAIGNLNAFEARFGDKFGKKKPRKIDVAAPDFDPQEEFPSRRDFLVPAYRFLYLSIPRIDGENDDTLFLLRAPFHGEPRRLPLAIQANDYELAAFREWEKPLRFTVRSRPATGEAT